MIKFITTILVWIMAIVFIATGIKSITPYTEKYIEGVRIITNTIYPTESDRNLGAYMIAFGIVLLFLIQQIPNKDE